ncbi:MAG: DUF488 domain-containing protein [Actinobacteria bacterium]|nr:DUF488 domain-containing protein [Actinomycetota bacterium]
MLNSLRPTAGGWPGSRRHPHFSRHALAEWLPAAGISYRWEPDLGGWRRARPDSPHVALHNSSFRGYADHMGTAGFWTALDAVLAEAAQDRTAVMCSETLWWRCHRRLLADAAALVRSVEVLHLGHDGGLVPHVPTEGVRRAGDELIYDVGHTHGLPGL